MCINDTGIVRWGGSSWGNVSFMELSNNCLDPASQFRFNRNGIMLNLKRQGSPSGLYIQTYSGYYLNMLYLYVDARPEKEIYRPINMTSWGGLSMFYQGYNRDGSPKPSIETWCAIHRRDKGLAHNYSIDDYVGLTTNCSDTENKRFNFGKFFFYNISVFS